MTIRIENSPTATDSLPTILWNNIFASGTLSASSEATGYPKENAISEATYSAWQPSSLPAQLTVDCGFEKHVDSFAIIAHDLGSKGLTVSLQSSDDSLTWTNQCVVSPKDNTSILGLFSGTSARYWRCDFSAKNLLTYTEQFNNAAWGKVRATVSASTTIAPDGVSSADTLVETVDTGTHRVAQTVAFEAGKTYTFSLYVKEQSARNVRLDFTAAPFGVTVTSVFDTTTGQLLSSTGSAEATTTENVGNGWFRVSVTKTATTTTSALVAIYPADGTNINYTGDGVSGVYIWGAQVEVGNEPSEYFKVEAVDTTNQPFVGVAMAGARFNFPAGVMPPYTPVWLSQRYELLTATTLGGQFLGNRVLRQGGQTSINLVSVDRTFGESTVLPFREHFNSGKAFVWAAGPSVFDKDVGYVWRTEGSLLAPTYDESGVLMSVNMEVYSYGE